MSKIKDSIFFSKNICLRVHVCPYALEIIALYYKCLKITALNGKKTLKIKNLR